jgi:hypothetical protein
MFSTKQSSFKTAGDWPGTIAAMVVRSPRSKMCLPFSGAIWKLLLVNPFAFISDH